MRMQIELDEARVPRRSHAVYEVQGISSASGEGESVDAIREVVEGVDGLVPQLVAG